MVGSDPDNPPEDPAFVARRAQDPIVGQLRPDPARPPDPTLRMSGFLGDSDRPGFRRLYFTRDLDYYAEFRVSDVVHLYPIPADEQPFRGEEATRVVLRRNASIDYTRTRVARPIDEFDLDVRLRRLGVEPDPHFLTAGPADSCFDCPVTPGTCQDTCQTCVTNCGTCETCVNWPTCEPSPVPDPDRRPRG
jgi:hypothetical protein